MTNKNLFLIVNGSWSASACDTRLKKLLPLDLMADVGKMILYFLHMLLNFLFEAIKSYWNYFSIYVVAFMEAVIY